jgi:hypothetical protein
MNAFVRGKIEGLVFKCQRGTLQPFIYKGLHVAKLQCELRKLMLVQGGSGL